jgi:hypothetical protein
VLSCFRDCERISFLATWRSRRSEEMRGEEARGRDEGIRVYYVNEWVGHGLVLVPTCT